LTGQDIVLVLGAYTALVLGAFGMLIKFVLDTRRATTETNKAVNNRPDNQPTLRQLVEDITDDMRELRHESNTRHADNSRRFTRLETDLRRHMNDVADKGE
jgi:hypothetical protein